MQHIRLKARSVYLSQSLERRLHHPMVSNEQGYLYVAKDKGWIVTRAHFLTLGFAFNNEYLRQDFVYFKKITTSFLFEL